MSEQDSDGGGKDIAKANKKKWEAVQKALELTDRAANFLGAVFGETAENIGGILSDQTKHWRAQNLDRIALLWKKKIKDRGISEDALKQLPFGDAFKVIEAASMEDDEDVQRLWADLIANATDPAKITKIKKVYIDLLKSLSSPEVILLNLLTDAESKTRFGSKEQIEAHDKKINTIANSGWRKLDQNTRNTAVQNLVRLRCLTYRPPVTSVKNLFQLPRDIDNKWPKGFALINANEFQKLMTYYEDIVLISSGVIDHKPADKIPLATGKSQGLSSISGLSFNIPEMNYMLTSMARDLLSACSEDSEEKVVA